MSDSHKTVSWIKAKILCLSQLLEWLDLDKLWPMALFVGCKHNSTVDLLHGSTPVQYINFWLLMISQPIFTSRRLHSWSVHLLGPTMDVVYLRDFCDILQSSHGCVRALSNGTGPNPAILHWLWTPS